MRLPITQTGRAHLGSRTDREPPVDRSRFQGPVPAHLLPSVQEPKPKPVLRPAPQPLAEVVEAVEEWRGAEVPATLPVTRPRGRPEKPLEERVHVVSPPPSRAHVEKMARASAPPNRGNSLPDAKREQLEALLRAGEPVKAAARAVGIAIGTARAARRRLGLPEPKSAATIRPQESHALAGTGSAYAPRERAAFRAGYYQAFEDLGWNVGDLRCRCGHIEIEHFGAGNQCARDCDCRGFRVRRIG